MIPNDFLPRQARDKRWGKTEKKGAFFAGERSTPLRSEVFVGSDVLILGAVIAFFGHLVATRYKTIN
jgi:hypothetical protein